MRERCDFCNERIFVFSVPVEFSLPTIGNEDYFGSRSLPETLEFRK